MIRVIRWPIGLVFCVALLAACGGGWDPGKEDRHRQAAHDTVADFRASDPALQRFFDEAAGYAVFPTIGKGAVGVGGAYGRGKLFEHGQIVGTTSVTQASIGFQWGGQAYSEIVFFGDQTALDRFKGSNLEVAAQASAVAATLGAAANADYSDGVAIFTLVKGGLMYEAAVGGQKFAYTPD